MKKSVIDMHQNLRQVAEKVNEKLEKQRALSQEIDYINTLLGHLVRESYSIKCIQELDNVIEPEIIEPEEVTPYIPAPQGVKNGYDFDDYDYEDGFIHVPTRYGRY